MKYWNEKVKTILALLVLCAAVLLLGILIGMRSKRTVSSPEPKYTVTSLTYANAQNNEIIYYCIQAENVGNREANPNMINLSALGCVVDFGNVEELQECRVNDRLAILYAAEDRKYLCWTLTQKASCVIEYTDGTVSEEDILRMAESVLQPEE